MEVKRGFCSLGYSEVIPITGIFDGLTKIELCTLEFFYKKNFYKKFFYKKLGLNSGNFLEISKKLLRLKFQEI